MSEAPGERSESAPAGWEEARERLKSLSRPDLIALLGELYVAGHSNRKAVHDKLGLPPVGTDSTLLTESKAKLVQYVTPHHDDPFELQAAVDVIEHYAAATSDRFGTVELLVHCLECGRLATEAYGDLFSEFYDTMMEVAERCAVELAVEPELIEVFRTRIEAILRAAGRIGWGYEDSLYGVFDQLQWDEDT